MCTYSIIPLAGNGGFRVAVNRDESHFRAPAFAPASFAPEGVEFVMPVDAEAGGTWVAVNAAGLVLALLNYAPGLKPGTAPRGRHSRGLVIPALAGATSLEQALARARAYDTGQTAPFRLLLTDGQTLAELASPGFGKPLISRGFGVARPLTFASSGLGDELVEPARRALAEELFNSPPEGWPSAQDALHTHRWHDRPEVSVYMSRQEARTVSITTIEVASGVARMSYQADLGGRLAPLQHASVVLTGHAVPPIRVAAGGWVGTSAGASAGSKRGLGGGGGGGGGGGRAGASVRGTTRDRTTRDRLLPGSEP